MAGRILINPPPFANFSDAVEASIAAASEAGFAEQGVYVQGFGGRSWESLLLLPGVYAGLERAGFSVAGPLVFHESRAELIPTDRAGRQELMIRLVGGEPSPPPSGWRVIHQRSSSLTAEDVTRVEQLSADLGNPGIDTDERMRKLDEVTAITTNGLGWQVLLRE